MEKDKRELDKELKEAIEKCISLEKDKLELEREIEEMREGPLLLRLSAENERLRTALEKPSKKTKKDRIRIKAIQKENKELWSNLVKQHEKTLNLMKQ